MDNAGLVLARIGLHDAGAQLVWFSWIGNHGTIGSGVANMLMSCSGVIMDNAGLVLERIGMLVHEAWAQLVWFSCAALSK